MTRWVGDGVVLNIIQISIALKWYAPHHPFFPHSDRHECLLFFLFLSPCVCVCVCVCVPFVLLLFPPQVCLAFNPQGDVVATGSMDNTAKLWDVNTGKEIHTLLGHTAEIVSLNFNTDGSQVITGSFDHTIKLWDVATGKCIHTLSGHHGEISSTQFNFSSELCISGSIDRTCKIWNVKTGQCLQTLRGHNDEILDVAFNATGSKVSIFIVLLSRVSFFLQS